MHPILVEIPTPWGTLPVYSYGVMLGLSLLAAWHIVMRLGVRKERLDRELMANAFIVAAITGLIGARALYVVTNLGEFESPAQWLELRSGGLVAYGGFLGGLAGSWAYLRWRKVPLVVWADLTAPALALGTALTRIGCYLYGCDFGKPLPETAPAWLKSLGTFPRWPTEIDPNLVCSDAMMGSPAYAHHLRTLELPPDATASLPVHPTQLYEALAALAIFGASAFVLHRRQFRGQVIFVTAGLYAIWRFCIEYLRDDPERGGAFDLSTSQLISLALLPAVAIGYVVYRKRSHDHGEPVVPESAREPTQQVETADAEPTAKKKGVRRIKRKKA